MTASEEIFNTKHFCILPWIHFHAWPDGKVFPCCMSDSSKPVSNTSEPSIIDLMNTQEFKELRLRMLNNEPSEICSRCYDVELFGTWSLRQSHNTLRGIANLDAVNLTNNDGSIDDFKMKYMDIRFSNVCNMKCRSCGPSCSSQWATEYKTVYGPERLQSQFGLNSTVISNNENDNFWNKLEPYLNDVEEVYFAGGESLITPEHYRILDYWLEHDRTDIRLSYTTNFSVFKYKNKNVLDYWRKFSNIEIFASLDASGYVAEYLRKGTEWQEIEENATMIKKEAPHVKFEISPTISIWNVEQFPEFHKAWIEKGLLSKDQDIRLNILTFPWFASILILPSLYKKKLIRLYSPMIYNEDYSVSIRNAYRTVVNTLESGEENKDGIREFFQFNGKLDDIRKEDLLMNIPYLEDLYKWSMK